ncbi:MAG: aminotransferase class V-fold PLP-dependent enzyme [Planctomycetes bacterium]|nr:aminotransferase class V-fold PLP-dependent enzyme [Planctomycetota bacterium]
MRINLDQAATTRIDPEALDVFYRIERNFPGNPSSVVSTGRAAKKILDDARDSILELLGANSARLVFTSGASESMLIAAERIHRALSSAGYHPKMMTSKAEHSSGLAGAKLFEALGGTCEFIRPLRDGTTTLPEDVDAGYVSLAHTNGETGAITDIRKAAERLRKHGAILHTDVAASIGKVPFDFGDAGAHLASFSAHKFHGPKGVGALIVSRDCPFPEALEPSSVEDGYRSGTVSPALAASMETALRKAVNDLERVAKHLREIRKTLKESLCASGLRPSFHEHENEAFQSPAVLSVAVHGIDARELLVALDLRGVEISLGAACSSLTEKPSRVLEACGIEGAELLASFRLSFSADTSLDDARTAASIIAEECLKRVSV